MRASFRLGTLLGIPIRVHATFLLLLVLFFLAEASESGTRAGLRGLLFTVLLFACVLLHELGHSVVAMRFGVTITSITLYPFGGIASLTEIPREPAREILIAVAGPLVNFAVATGLYVGMIFLLPQERLSPATLLGQSLPGSLFSANLLLGLFNLIPAYPMDGGRLLRGILASRMDYGRATRWAAGVGKVFAVLFVILGFRVDWWLSVIGVFLYFGATSEEQSTVLLTAMERLRVRDLMITRYLTVSPAQTLTEVLHLSLHSFQEDFPVVREGSFTGVITRSSLLEALRRGGRDQYVQGLARAVESRVSPEDSARDAMRKLREAGVGLLPVVEEGQMVGIVTMSGILRGTGLLAETAERV